MTAEDVRRARAATLRKAAAVAVALGIPAAPGWLRERADEIDPGDKA